jgi:hypothetical protein
MRELIAPTPTTVAEAAAGATAPPAGITRVGDTSIAPFGPAHIRRVPATTSVPASPQRPLRMVWTVVAGTQTPRLAGRWRREADPTAPAV